MTNDVDMSVDNTPPGQVTDLRVTNLPDGIRVEFTAPGNDYDSNDAAAEYIIKFSSTAGNLTGSNFDKEDDNTRLTQNNLIESDLVPVKGGTVKAFKIMSALFNKDEKYVLAMKASDDSKNLSPVSNKVQIFIPVPAQVIHRIALTYIRL